MYHQQPHWLQGSAGCSDDMTGFVLSPDKAREITRVSTSVPLPTMKSMSLYEVSWPP